MKLRRDVILPPFLLLALMTCCYTNDLVAKRNFRLQAANRISHGFGKRADNLGNTDSDTVKQQQEHDYR